MSLMASGTYDAIKAGAGKFCARVPRARVEVDDEPDDGALTMAFPGVAALRSHGPRQRQRCPSGALSPALDSGHGCR